MNDVGSLMEEFFKIPFKGGRNDLSRWKAFGGSLERPKPPASITKKQDQA